MTKERQAFIDSITVGEVRRGIELAAVFQWMHDNNKTLPATLKEAYDLIIEWLHHERKRREEKHEAEEAQANHRS